MKLIIGGAFQGKTDYAERRFHLSASDWADGAVCSGEDLFRKKGIRHFHEWVRRQLEKGEDITDLAEELADQNPDVVIVTNELGYGIVPMDRFDRMYREAEGRLCTQLAALSDEVCRVVCGCGQIIKKE
ncbi:MAG: bifunctional adenosylcobinamide kinase/adenosylcobinamide-phosphate guanylyltransferase [Eubacterium sp.]|nr:bifunctional adenosylcobinamide kinase/adenosylcobinamide-phosphate guanylyltransferase [Eubacterium sp.]